MVLVDNTNRDTALRLLRTVENDIHTINEALREEENAESKLDATYVAGRNAVAIASGEAVVGKIKWFMESKLSRPATPALDDAAIDAIDANIRQHEDGL